MTDHWWYMTVVLDGGSSADEDALLSAADVSGSIGAEVVDAPGAVRVRAYYRSDQGEDVWRQRLASALASCPGAMIEETGRIENQQWSQQSEDAFPPLPVGHGLVVLAPWHRGSEPEGRLPIYINPGSAFGTGYHASTQVALTLLEERVASGESIDRVADIGTGSGILSIASIKLGASRSLARDIDPAVISEARANAELNQVPEGTITAETGDLLKGVSEKFDLLFANILLEPNMALLPSVADVLRPGGAAIFSGMTESESPEFLAAMSCTPLKISKTTVIEEWWGVLAEYPA